MMAYKELYFTLFNSISDSLTQMEQGNYGQATTTLKQAQLNTESLYADMTDTGN